MELALEAGISQGFLAMIEANRKVPTVTTIFKIANALSVKPSIFLNFQIQTARNRNRKSSASSALFNPTKPDSIKMRPPHGTSEEIKRLSP